MMFDFDRDMKADRMVDYIANLQERQERLEEIVGVLSERLAALEAQVATLTDPRGNN